MLKKKRKLKIEPLKKRKDVNLNSDFKMYTLKKQTLKITQLEKVRFIKMNKLKLTQFELF